MQYKVYNERNIQVIVTQEQLEEAQEQNGKNLSVEILAAMSQSLNPCFASRFCEALYHEKQRARIVAIYALLSLLNRNNLFELRKKEQSIPDQEMKVQINEKAIIQAVLLRLEGGAEGVRSAFFGSDINPLVKTLLLSNYSCSNMPITKQDAEFLISALEAYVNKSELWLQKIKNDEYQNDIITCLEGLMRASEAGSLFKEIDAEYIEKLKQASFQILKMRIDSYAKEIIATYAKELPPKIAYKMLEPILGGSAKGDVRKELERTLKVLRQEEEKKE